jgi:hypothetical protein
MEIKCEFCHKVFSNKYNLKRHQSNTNKCKKIQEEEKNSEYVCKFCKKIYTSKKYLDKHIKNCSHYKNNQIKVIEERHQKEIEDLKQLYEKKIVQQKIELEKNFEKALTKLNTKISQLQINHEIQLEENKEYYENILQENLKDHQTEKMNLLENYNQLLINNNGKVVNNTINNNYNITLIPFTKDSIPIDEITIHDLKKGITGISELLLKSITVDKEKGLYNYICSDPSRNMYKYFSMERKWVKDINGQYIKDVFYPTILPKFKEIYKNYQEHIEMGEDVEEDIEKNLEMAQRIVKLDTNDKNLHQDVLNEIKGHIYIK